MGFRFRRSVRIAKGFNINFSKRCVGISVGPKGAKISMGPSGNYANLGVPGTGIRYRKKLGSSSAPSNHQNQNHSYSHSPTSGSSYLPSEIMLEFDQDAKEIIIKNKLGIVITDPSTLRKIKRDPRYKEGVQKMYKMIENASKEKTREFTEIHKLTPDVLSLDFWNEQLEKMKNEELEKYSKSVFYEPRPSFSSVEFEVRELAEKEAKKVFFLKRKKFIARFMEEEGKKILEEKLAKWEKIKGEFENAEEEKRIEFERKIFEKHNEELLDLKKAMAGNKDTFYKLADDFLESMTMPFNFSVNYELEGVKLKVDLELPTIDEVEESKATVTEAGRLSLKNKTVSELNHDYITGICGLAFFFAGNFFNIGPKIDEILVSGYIHSISKKTGKMENEYLYSIFFDRKTFREINVEMADPIEAFKNFKNKLALSKTFKLKEIEPF